MDFVHPFELHSSFFPPQVTVESEKLQAVDFHVVWSSSPDALKYKPYFSMPELIEFPTEVPGQNAYAYFYPPSNPSYQAADGERPPLLLKSHGIIGFYLTSIITEMMFLKDINWHNHAF